MEKTTLLTPKEHENIYKFLWLKQQKAIIKELEEKKIIDAENLMFEYQGQTIPLFYVALIFDMYELADRILEKTDFFWLEKDSKSSIFSVCVSLNLFSYLFKILEILERRKEMSRLLDLPQDKNRFKWWYFFFKDINSIDVFCDVLMGWKCVKFSEEDYDFISSKIGWSPKYNLIPPKPLYFRLAFALKLYNKI